jgi:hypothetical protein
MVIIQVSQSDPAALPPDYVLAHESVAEKLVGHLAARILSMFGPDPSRSGWILSFDMPRFQPSGKIYSENYSDRLLICLFAADFS